MITLDFSEAAALMNAEARIPDPASIQTIKGVSSDSRHLQSGELFVALSGPNFDAMMISAD